MPAHTHDGIDWVARLADLRQADELNAPTMRVVARRLVDSLPAPSPSSSPSAPRPTVLDVGSGAGGMSAALAAALAERGGGTLVLVDAVPELLTAAAEAATLASPPKAASPSTAASLSAPAPAPAPAPIPLPGPAAGGVPGHVDVRTVLADLTDPAQVAGLPPADLLWASNVMHHLPDQRLGVQTLVGLLAPGGLLALSEGGLSVRCLPWDVGVGEPGLQDRLAAAHGTWFRKMRTEMPGSTRMPVGWNRTLTDAGLASVSAFSFLVDVPPPASDLVRASVVRWLAWMTDATDGLLSDADTAALRRLLDPDDPAFVGARDDVFLLKADTVYYGTAP